MTSSRVSGHTVELRATPTITAGAYTSGDQLGGLMTLTFSMQDKSNWTSLTLTNLTIVDLDKENVDVEVLFWKKTPTLVADNAVADFDDTELKTIFCGSINTAHSTSYDWNSYNDNSSFTWPVPANVIKISNEAYGSTAATREDITLYASAVIRGTPTGYASTGDLTFIFNFAVDAEY